MLLFYPWYTRMRKAGLTGSSSREVLQEALRINSGEALEAALLGCLCAASNQLAQAGIPLETRREAMLGLWQMEEMQTVRKRLKLIQHEAC